jgi:hypothetical protein
MIVDLQNFIAKYKNTDDLRSVYYDFEINWLKEINENIKKDVLTNLECVENKIINGEDDIDNKILQDFIVALEKLVEKMEN